MFLHDPVRIKKRLCAPLVGLRDDLSHALKTVNQVRSGQAGNIARAEVRDA
jgi:hypothetical protein